MNISCILIVYQYVLLLLKPLIIKIMKYKDLLICAGVMCSFAIVLNSCSKNINDIYITTQTPGNNGNNNGNNGSGGSGTNDNQALLQFSAGIESQNTKSVNAFPQGRFATIYSYPSGTATTSADPTVSMSYTANSPGILSPVGGTAMYLPNGNWDFYSVATNQKSASAIPVFNKGLSGTLLNGIDYIYWSASKLAVAPPQLTIPITYSHSCTQVTVKLVSGNGITIDSLISATITPSQTSSTMALSTGVITPATALSSTPVNMGVAAHVAHYTMLPVQTSSKANATFSILINGEKTARNYQVSFSIPSTGWTAGNSYVYQATVNANEIVFSPVSVRDWIPVDETNIPLYPTQI